MPAFLSIVIPTLNSTKTIAPTLMSLSEGITTGLIKELIISDGNSTDAINEMCEEIGAILINGQKGRGIQLHRGAMQAKGEWILFIHSDTVLPIGWTDAFFNHIKTKKKAGYCKLTFDEASIKAKIVSTGANLRSKFLKLPYGDQTLLISRKLYKGIGGYPDLPIMEDVSIAKLLKNNLDLIPINVKTSSKRYKQNGWFGQSIKNLTLFIMFKLGVDPKKLAKIYNKYN